MQWLLAQARTGITIHSTRRSHLEQSRLYRAYLRGEREFPVLPPGASMHEYGLAVDLGAAWWELARLGAIWRKAGGVWGGRYDPPHFEAGPAMLR